MIRRQDLLTESRFSTNESRIRPENREFLMETLAKTFSLKSSAEWMKILQQAGVPAGPLNSIDKSID